MAKQAVMETGYLDEEARASLVRRINRAGGQVNGLRKMVEEGECVDKLLIQISAAKSALTHVALELTEGHLVNCTETWMPGRTEEVIRRVTRALSAVLKNG